MGTVMTIVECLGVVSFAVSGTIVALGKKTDAVGALILSLLTVFGGGLIRDLTIGVIPPHVFWDKEYALYAVVAVPTSLICFHLAFYHKTAFLLERHKNDFWLNLFDTIGLAVFCVSGVDVAVQSGFAENPVLLIFAGCITGVGGGVLRDLFSCEVPLLFRKHIYLLPTIAGAALYVYIYPVLPHLFAMLFSMLLIISVRVPAIIFRWNLPTPQKNKPAPADKPSSEK